MISCSVTALYLISHHLTKSNPLSLLVPFRHAHSLIETEKGYLNSG
jgi:hypothetical protein